MWQNEPALIIAFVDAIIVLAVAFGAPITSDEKVAIDGVISAGAAIAAGILIRQQVMPMTKVKAKLKKAKAKTKAEAKAVGQSQANDAAQNEV